MNRRYGTMTGFYSFRSRLIAFMLVLLLPVFAAIYLVITQNSRLYTIQTINSYLESGADVFDFTLQQQTRMLGSILSSLTWDYGFRTAFGSGDEATLFDASLNVLDRSLGSVEMLMVVDLEGRVIVDTSLQGLHKLHGPWNRLLKAADRNAEGIAEAILPVQGTPHRLLVVPLYLPHQVAWIIGGYPMGQQVLNQVKRNTLSDVSLLSVKGDQSEVLASTLPRALWDSIGTQFQPEVTTRNSPQQLVLENQLYGTLTRLLSDDTESGERIMALIHRSYQENLAIQQGSEQFLKQWYLLVLAISITAVWILSKSITSPIVKLAGFVRSVEKGDYDVEVDLHSRDEFGQLAESVNSMARSLAEKEKARDLLGKVVSPQIADQLIEKRVNLEGEKKIVTIMYVDVRGFTSFCEGKNPAYVLRVLNRYLKSVVGLIETYHGVVDKFMGDGVMALYGAPLEGERDIQNALDTALLIKEHWQARPENANEQNTGEDLVACIGIHTGLVVAGNVGSINRMNYSVVGDAVNLAARLENLTRYYGVPCIVSEDTASQASGFLFRELDLVRVYGRQDVVRIYELLGKPGDIEIPLLAEKMHFERFLAEYRSQNWDAAAGILDGLAPHRQYDQLHSVYRDRVRYFREHPPGPDWPAIYDFKRK